MKSTIVGLIAVVLVACNTEKPAPPTQPQRAVTNPPKVTSPRIEPITSPAGDASGEPFLSATKDGVLLSWLEPVAGTDRTALRFARYGAGKWSDARTIVERDDLFVNWADFPSIVEDAKGTLFAQWLQKGAKGSYSYDDRMAVSHDGGSKWGEPFLLNRDGKRAEHGFASLVPLPAGGIAVAWLDGRNMKEGNHEEEGSGDMTLRYANVDGEGHIADEVELDGRTCECCTTGMAMTSSGPVIVYRDRSAEEVRDIAFITKSGNGWSQPAIVNADGWKIHACPVNGPQIDAIGSHAAVAWFTAAENKPRAFVAFSDDAGKTFGKPLQIDEGTPAGHVDVVLLDESTALVTWIEQKPGGGEVRARVIGRDGKSQPPIAIGPISTPRAFPRMARVGREVFFAWTEAKKVHVARGTF